MLDHSYADYAWEQTAALLAIDSPSGYTEKAAAWVRDAFQALGFPAELTVKGGVLADLGGREMHIVPGSEKNIKVTTVEDLEILKALMHVHKESWLK